MDFSKLMQNMPDLLAKKQEEMRNTIETGNAGVDDLSVKITVNGLYEVKKVDISEGACTAGKAVLEDLVKSAFVSAKQKIDERNKSNFGAGIPGLSGLAGMFGGDKK